ncbi:hypothetical protein [Plesiomonas shigelloides]|uniref:hypothetical protein n=1 Tax=Plesiomonas shigelloides TaxID=703 RepID=UPI0012626F97|nr:hypothetical protein [Plesiomonas shigelloides]KAB7671895.1 hypothetical protein GBN18_01075 [Plesiomonas shigelloides]
MSTIDLNNLTGAESLDELEAALEALEKDEGSDAPEIQDGEAGKQTDNAAQTETDVNTESSTAEAQQADSEEAAHQEPALNAAESAEKVIASKDGKHIIPYDVLDHERREKQQERREKQALQEQLQQAVAEREKLQRLLEKYGIPADADPDSISIEEIEQLAQDYPEIGKALTGIVNKLNKFEQAEAAKQAVVDTPDPLQAALQAVPELVKWNNEDPDRMAFAISVDERLQHDPAWKDKPLQERFAEAARRTRIAFNDERPAEPAEKPATDEKKPTETAKEPEVVKRDRIPESPSDIGQSVQHSATGIEKYQSMTQEQLMAEMSSMNPAQIEALLAQYDL